MKQFIHTLLHAAYGGAAAGLAAHAYSGGPITLKTAGFALLGGAVTGITRAWTNSGDSAK